MEYIDVGDDHPSSFGHPSDITREALEVSKAKETPLVHAEQLLGN